MQGRRHRPKIPSESVIASTRCRRVLDLGIEGDKKNGREGGATDSGSAVLPHLGKLARRGLAAFRCVPESRHASPSCLCGVWVSVRARDESSRVSLCIPVSCNRAGPCMAASWAGGCETSLEAESSKPTLSARHPSSLTVGRTCTICMHDAPRADCCGCFFQSLVDWAS